jgi:sporulation protein YlmC with PRC-barrel domain
MRIDLDARVRTSDGREAGSVQRVILDPSTNQIEAFVVSTGGLGGHDVVVPHADLAAASDDGDAVRLSLSKDELERLEPFAPEQFMAPPVGWMAPPLFGYPENAYVWPASYAGTAPVAAGAYAGAAVGGTRPDTEAETAPTGAAAASAGEVGDIDVPKGTPVFDRNGEDVGVVDDVRFDNDTGQLMGFVVRAGGALRTFFGGGETTEIARSLIDHVGGDGVYLRVLRDEVAGQAADAARRG